MKGPVLMKHIQYTKSHYSKLRFGGYNSALNRIHAVVQKLGEKTVFAQQKRVKCYGQLNQELSRECQDPKSC